MLKNLIGPPFTVLGIVRIFKRNNFCPKMRFSQAQHAISDIFLKTGVFLCDFFKSLFSPKPLLIFFQKRNVLRAVRTPQGFRHYETYRRPSKKFPSKFFFSIFCFFRVSLEKDGFFAVFSWGRMVFETRVFLAL